MASSSPQESVFPPPSPQEHQPEVLAAVDAKRSRRRGGGEEEEGVWRAMRWSLSEGWSLLLHLLDRRREALRLAADFYHWLAEVRRCEDVGLNP